ncbi:unnamed protein product, partial [marine sediment metagenome]
SEIKLFFNLNQLTFTIFTYFKQILGIGAKKVKVINIKYQFLGDKKSGEIIKYPYLEDLKWGSPQLWLNSQTKKAIDSESIAVDGSVWVLNKDNSISRYYAGKYQETLKLDFFPEPKDFSKIFTLSGLSYLYLLEPGQSRMVILNKTGQIIKQFQSEKFDNLLDFAISEDGKTIYLLNGLKVYQIKF